MAHAVLDADHMSDVVPSSSGSPDRNNRDTLPDPEQMPPRRSFGGIRLFRVAGIEIDVDWSLFAIFALVTFSMGSGVLPRWHPEWSGALVWIVAVTAAILFFVSVLLHELSHALVGRANGIPIRRITLFVFGGVAHLESEPATPKAELLMAIVGPITSIVIGGIATLAGLALAGPATQVGDDPELVARAMGPGTTLLLWLGPINLMLGIFNLVPGFPLDGGRVLRAALWSATGDLTKATRWASGAGRVFAGMLMACGILMIFGFRLPFFGSGTFGGLWLVLIGWFLNNAARASYAQVVVRQRLSHVPVTQVMLSRLRTVNPDMTVDELVHDYVMGTDQTSFPVLEGSSLVGLVGSRDVRNVPYDQWPFVSVRQLMTPASNVTAIDASAGADEALEKLASSDADQLPVVDHGEVRGFVRRQDILKWLTLQPDAIA
jgi:Zn-dependent protease/CBS domain-containing protein